ncbi:MAG: hypothetical protein LBR77_06090 [Lachnospiraceae bacterium]|nr:hypothetical protein [Lachnospiraceae bacterium]
MTELSVYYCPACGSYAYYQLSQNAFCFRCNVHRKHLGIRYQDFMDMGKTEREVLISRRMGAGESGHGATGSGHVRSGGANEETVRHISATLPDSGTLEINLREKPDLDEIPSGMASEGAGQSPAYPPGAKRRDGEMRDAGRPDGLDRLSEALGADGARFHAAGATPHNAHLRAASSHAANPSAKYDGMHGGASSTKHDGIHGAVSSAKHDGIHSDSTFAKHDGIHGSGSSAKHDGIHGAVSSARFDSIHVRSETYPGAYGQELESLREENRKLQQTIDWMQSAIRDMLKKSAAPQPW